MADEKPHTDMFGGMTMRVSNQIVVSRDEPCFDKILDYSKAKLSLINPEYVKKKRMGFWLGNTPKAINLYQIVNGDLVLPYGALNDVLRICPNATVEFGFAEQPCVEYDCSVPLYDYQIEAVEGMVRGGFGILCSKAGSGKTQVGIALIARLKRRTLWLTTTKDLLSQSKERAERYIDKSLLGTITEGKVNISTGITFATIQTMCKMDLSLYRDYWDVIVVDECHRCVSSPTTVTMFGKVVEGLSARHKYGLTATVHRADGLIEATFALLGKVVHTVPDEAIADKVMTVKIQRQNTGTQIHPSCLDTDGTLVHAKLINYLAGNSRRNFCIANDLVENADHYNLILSDRLEHLRWLISAMPDELQEQCVMIDGSMTTKKGKAEREQAIEDMRNGKKRYLFASYSLAREGLDIPRLDRLYMATPVKDYAVVVQSVGRIARTFDGKSEPICYDYVDDISYLQKMFSHRLRHYRKGGCLV